MKKCALISRLLFAALFALSCQSAFAQAEINLECNATTQPDFEAGLYTKAKPKTFQEHVSNTIRIGLVGYIRDRSKTYLKIRSKEGFVDLNGVAVPLQLVKETDTRIEADNRWYSLEVNRLSGEARLYGFPPEDARNEWKANFGGSFPETLMWSFSCKKALPKF